MGNHKHLLSDTFHTSITLSWWSGSYNTHSPSIFKFLLHPSSSPHLLFPIHLVLIHFFQDSPSVTHLPYSWLCVFTVFFPSQNRLSATSFLPSLSSDYSFMLEKEQHQNWKFENPSFTSSLTTYQLHNFGQGNLKSTSPYLYNVDLLHGVVRGANGKMFKKILCKQQYKHYQQIRKQPGEGMGADSAPSLKQQNLVTPRWSDSKESVFAMLYCFHLLEYYFISPGTPSFNYDQITGLGIVRYNTVGILINFQSRPLTLRSSKSRD